MQGSLDLLLQERGSGLPVIETAVGREPLGSAPGASTRVSLGFNVPPAPGRLAKALLTLGLEASRELRPPIRMKIALSRGGVTREFKPQFRVELDDTIYYKAVYDVKPIMVRRVAKTSFHSLDIVYDLVHPVFFRDASLILVFEVEGAKYAVSFLTGAKVLEPGEVTVEYPPFYEYFGGSRTAGMIIHSPYADSSFQIVVAGTQGPEIRGQGGFHVVVPFTYRGSLVPVSVKYNDAPYKFYPRRAVLTDVYLTEVKTPPVGMSVEVSEHKVENGKLRVRAVIKNTGEDALKRVVVSLVSIGGQLAARRLREVPPGQSVEVRLTADLSRLPVPPSKIVLSVSAYSMGRRLEESSVIELGRVS